MKIFKTQYGYWDCSFDADLFLHQIKAVTLSVAAGITVINVLISNM